MSKEKQNEELTQMYRDLCEIFDEEYEKRRLITPLNTAEKMTAKGYRKQSEWISVEERLPEDGVRVLTGCDDGIVRLGISKGGFPSVLNRQHRFSDVTHWMPLPEAPKMKGGGEG